MTLAAYADQIRRLAAQGCSDGRIAAFLNTTEARVYAFRRRHSISTALKPGQNAITATPEPYRDPGLPVGSEAVEAAWARAFRAMGRNYAGVLP